jgi:glutamate-1-semialdehyde 2,1-aminomutase
MSIDRAHLSRLILTERERFASTHPRSQTLADRARASLLTGVPMTWMAKWPGGFPIHFVSAHGAEIEDADGLRYADFCLGDSGAMAGHSPPATVAAVRRRLEESGGATTMLPNEDGATVGEELARRFGLPLWQFTLSATDANRFVLRLCRQVTRRPRVLVFSGCYHGSVDESLIVLGPDGPRARRGNVGPAVDPTTTTAVVEWNDAAALVRELERGDIACVLAEPALTNIGIVLPEVGFHAALREATRRTGTLLVLDETHTLSMGWGGCTRAWSLEPDVVSVGKAIGGGVPIGAFGLSAEIAERILAERDADYVDAGGIGGTLAGNALSLAAARATLSDVLTEAAFARMRELCGDYVAGVEEILERHALPWSIVQLGARAEIRFARPAPRSGSASGRAADPELDEFLHLFLLNRGVLLTPFHNMSLVSPATTPEQVSRHLAAFAECCDALASRGR